MLHYDLFVYDVPGLGFWTTKEEVFINRRYDYPLYYDKECKKPITY